MAGQPGRSGGARPNSGGARKGAGRPKGSKNKATTAPAIKKSANARKRAAPLVPEVEIELEPQAHGGSLKRSHAVEPEPSDALQDGAKREPLEFLELVMNDPMAPLKDRIRSAIAAAQYRHMKRGDGGKKEEAADKAKKAAGGKFGVRQGPPSLKVVGG